MRFKKYSLYVQASDKLFRTAFRKQTSGSDMDKMKQLNLKQTNHQPEKKKRKRATGPTLTFP